VGETEILKRWKKNQNKSIESGIMEKNEVVSKINKYRGKYKDKFNMYIIRV
jgi:hypothetical protein